MVGVVKETDEVEERVIFTYGTLKRGFSNHGLMEELIATGDAVFLGSYRTTLNYPLVCGPYRVPFLLNLPGSGNHRVIGELYGVTAAGLARLDILEGTSRSHYQRLPITVEEYSCDIIGNDEDADDEDEDEEDEDDGGVKRKRRTRRAEAYYAHSSYALKLWNKDGRKGFASYSTEVARGYVSRKDRPQHLTFLGHIHSFLHDQQQQQDNNLLL